MGTIVGLLGTGRMGSAMARALSASGFELVLWNRTAGVAEALAAELGARVAATPADVARTADICISMLADGPAVDGVYGGHDGLIAGARRGAVLVDCSTVPPSVLQAHEAAADAAGASLLDAPVSGSVTLAEAGKLTLMVGGPAEALERVRPVLDPLSSTIFHMGPLGSGAAMKLAVNTVIFGLNQAVAEGLVLAEAAGIPRELAYDVIAAGATGAPYVTYKRAAFIDPEGTPVAFALDLAAKDLRLIGDLARRLGRSIPQADTNLAVIDAVIAEMGGDADFSMVASYLRDRQTAQEGATA